MIKLRCPVVVEGKYDRIKLASVIDGIIFETGGFRIYKNREMTDALRVIAKDTGLIILTDSDAAGCQIRNHLKKILGPDAKLTHVYVPALHGKEKRKREASAEGLLGVEGMDEQTLIDAFSRAGVGCEGVEKRADLTRADLFDAGLIGAPDAAQKRTELLKKLSLPPHLSTTVMLELLNTRFTREEFIAALK